jgi:hypothetical protein
MEAQRTGCNYANYRTATMDSNFWHFERAAEGRQDQIRIPHFERDFGEFGDLFAQDSNGPAVRTNLWDGLQQGASAQRLDCCVLAWSSSNSGMPMLLCRLCPHLQPPKAALYHNLYPQPLPPQPLLPQPLPPPAFGLCPNLHPGHNRRAAYSRGRATSTEPEAPRMHAEGRPCALAVVAMAVVFCEPPGPPPLPPWPADRLAVRADPSTAEPQPQLHLGARA